jgi:hypothetical protein
MLNKQLNGGFDLTPCAQPFPLSALDVVSWVKTVKHLALFYAIQ